MTVHRLSPRSVKVLISAEELHTFFSEPVTAPDSPQMMRLLALMLAHAEHTSGIPFSALPVTVELLSAQDGSLAAYFTAQSPQPETKHRSRRSGSLRLAAKFHEHTVLAQCCSQLRQHPESIRQSELYQYAGEYVLTLRLDRKNAKSVHHILLEYGTPFRLSAMNRARLSEYGICLCAENAVAETAGEESPQ